MKDLIEYLNEAIKSDPNRKEQEASMEELADDGMVNATINDIDSYLKRRTDKFWSKSDREIFNYLYDLGTPYKEYKDMYDDIEKFNAPRKEKNIFLKAYDNVVNGIQSLIDKFRK